MGSAFSHLADLIDRARKADGAPRPTADARQTQQDHEAERRDREAYRAQSRQDIIDGRRMFLEQQAARQAEADPEAQRLAFFKAQALKICNAGRAARGQPLLERLMQDEEPSDEYPGRDNYNSPGNPDDGGDDQPSPKDKKGKKVTKKKVQDEDDGEQGDADEPRDEGGDDFDSDDEKKKRDKRAALMILNAGRRAKGLPLLTLQDML